MKVPYLSMLILMAITESSCMKYGPFNTICSSSSGKTYYNIPTDSATTIIITPGNGDTSSYPNTTNFIKTIYIKAIQSYPGSTPSKLIGEVVNYTTAQQKDSTPYSIKYVSDSDFVNVNSAFMLSRTMVQFQVNLFNSNKHLFNCYNGVNSFLYQRIYQQNQTKQGYSTVPGLAPVVLIENVWGYTDLVALGKMINAIIMKTKDSTINYNYF